MGRTAAFAIALGLAAIALIGCGRRGGESAVAAGTSEQEARAADSLRADRLLSAAASAAAFHRDLADLDWITGLMASAAESSATGFDPRGFGGALAAPAVAPEPSLQAAFEKAAVSRPHRLGPAPHGRALAKAAAADIPEVFEGDTSWFDYSDSARGRVNWIHVLRDPDYTVTAQVRDSLVYRWPCFDSVPVLMSSSTALRRFQGGEYRFDLNDEDGDGTLNGSISGQPVRVRETWSSSFGDTLRQSVWHLDRSVEARAGEDEGAVLSFSDTVFVSGRALSWSASSDADGDGFALRCDPGCILKVATERVAVDAAGGRRCTRIVAGPGPDSDWSADADNLWYAYASADLSPMGDTLETARAADADGDGMIFDPAAAENRVAIERRRPAGPGRPAYRDSVVKILGDPSRTEDDRIASARARLDWPDGSVSLLATAAAHGTAAFGAGDTVRVRETRVWPATAHRPGEPDSMAREAEVEAGDPADPDDDQVLWYEARTWWPQDAPVLASAELHAGGTLTYSATLPGGRAAFGRYEAGTGRFADTLGIDSLGDRAILEGTWSRDGGADYAVLRPGAGNRRHVRVTRDGSGFSIRVGDGLDSLHYDQSGDTTRWFQARGGLRYYHVAAADGEGGYKQTLIGLDADGLPRVDGTFAFAPGGGGSGFLRDREGQGLRTGFRFARDGSVHPEASD